MRLRPALASLLSAAGAVLAAGALATSGVAHAAVDLNVIRAVDVKDEGGTIVLTVQGSRPPNFTTFSMADPPRFVIDLSESRFQGVPEDLVVQDGIVNVVKSLSYGSDATSIARVMVAFLVDVDPPDVQAVGNALVVRVTKPAGVGVAAAPAAKAAEAEARAAAERKAAEAAAEQRAREEQARAEADRRAAEAQAEADKAAQAQAQADAEKAAQAQAQADAEKAAQADAQAEAARLAAEAQARAEQEAKAQADAAQASAERDADAGRKAIEEQIARAEAEKAAHEEEQRRAREAYEAERQAALAKASAPAAPEAAPEPTRGEVAAAAEPVDPAPAREPRADAEPQAEPVAEQAFAASAAPAAEPEAAVDAAPAQETEPASDELAATALAPAPSAQLREVGFRQLPGSSRVFFRTSVTPRFSVQDVGENVIRVELENTRAVRRNDTRFLDTSFFSSAVAMVTPMRRGTSYVVEIKLRERVPYQQRIEGDMLALDFARPAAIAAGPGAEPAADPAAQPDPLSGEGEPLAPAAAPAN
jgi:hypothetical protein